MECKSYFLWTHAVSDFIQINNIGSWHMFAAGGMESDAHTFTAARYIALSVYTLLL